MNKTYIDNDVEILIESKILEEIKPFRLLYKDNNPEKFLAANEYCTKNNLCFRVMTEKELGIKI